MGFGVPTLWCQFNSWHAVFGFLLLGGIIDLGVPMPEKRSKCRNVPKDAAWAALGGHWGSLEGSVLWYRLPTVARRFGALGRWW